MSPGVQPCLIPPAWTTWTRRQSRVLLMGHQGTGDKHNSINCGLERLQGEVGMVQAAGPGSCLTQPPGSAEQEDGGRMTQEMLFAWGQAGSGE